METSGPTCDSSWVGVTEHFRTFVSFHEARHFRRCSPKQGPERSSMEDRNSRWADAGISIGPRQPVPTPEQLPSLDVEALRASIRNISAIDDPHDWASQNLILGA